MIGVADTTPTWVPVAAAGAALIGGALGAWLQSAFSHRSWLRQTRLDAYAKFIDAQHEFHNALLAALDTFGGNLLNGRDGTADPFGTEWLKVLDAELLIGRAGSMVEIAGPAAAVQAMLAIFERTHALTAEAKATETLALAAAAIDRPDGYDKLNDWITAANTFAKTARKVLKTE